MRVLGLAAALVLAGGLPARADGDRALSVGIDYATFSAPGIANSSGQTPSAASPSWGAGVSGSYEQALSTDISLRGELAGDAFSGGLTDPKHQTTRSYAGVGDVGVLFRFDVLRVVPYAFGGVGGIVATGGPLATTGLVLAIGGGVTFLVDRRRSVGAEVRIASFGTGLTVVTFGVRLSTRWGQL